MLLGIREWFRWYKLPDQKPLNVYAFDGKAVDREIAEEAIRETHEQWRNLVQGKTKSKLWAISDNGKKSAFE